MRDKERLGETRSHKERQGETRGIKPFESKRQKETQVTKEGRERT